MRESIAEIIVGALVVIVAVIFMVFAVNTGGKDSGTGSNSYELAASFNSVSGINEGSDVRVSGIKIGVVTALNLDPETYMAQLTMSVNDTVRLPTDSTARISSDGLLGGSHIALEPGSDEDILQPGQEIQYTRGSIDLLTLLGGFIGRSGGK